MMDEKYVSEIVASVVKSMTSEKSASGAKQKGVFPTMSEALAAVEKAYKQYRDYSIEQREKMISKIRELTLAEAEVMAKMGVEETGMGRVSDKIIKHQLVANKTPGTEDLHPSAFSGDCGLTLIEMAPYGVIGSITPSTNPSETVICNSIGMIAGGNAVVFNPHPNACKVANYAVDLVNRAILEAGGPENLVVTVEKPTKESSDEMMAAPIVKMLVATGGPGVVKALLSSGKKAIGAGAGNPPVIVDDTANIEKAAKDIVAGASFDNNLPCIAEKECFAFDNIADDLIKYMTQNGAYLIKGEQIDQLVKVCLVEKNGKYCINKDWVGRDASKFLKAIGIESDARLVIAEVPADHPFVYVEMMMPVLGIVRVLTLSVDMVGMFTANATQAGQETWDIVYAVIILLPMVLVAIQGLVHLLTKNKAPVAVPVMETADASAAAFDELLAATEAAETTATEANTENNQQ